MLHVPAVFRAEPHVVIAHEPDQGARGVVDVGREEAVTRLPSAERLIAVERDVRERGEAGRREVDKRG